MAAPGIHQGDPQRLSAARASNNHPDQGVRIPAFLSAQSVDLSIKVGARLSIFYLIQALRLNEKALCCKCGQMVSKSMGRTRYGWGYYPMHIRLTSGASSIRFDLIAVGELGGIAQCPSDRCGLFAYDERVGIVSLYRIPDDSLSFGLCVRAREGGYAYGRVDHGGRHNQSETGHIDRHSRVLECSGCDAALLEMASVNSAPQNLI